MADIGRAKRGDLVKCNMRGFVFYALVTGAAARTSPRVFELPIRTINGGHWLRDADTSSGRPVGPEGSELRVRGRAVETLYRQLKS